MTRFSSPAPHPDLAALLPEVVAAGGLLVIDPNRIPMKHTTFKPHVPGFYLFATRYRVGRTNGNTAVAHNAEYYAAPTQFSTQLANAIDSNVQQQRRN